MLASGSGLFGEGLNASNVAEGAVEQEEGTEVVCSSHAVFGELDLMKKQTQSVSLASRARRGWKEEQQRNPTRESENVKVRLLRLIDSRHKNKNNYITFIAEEEKEREAKQKEIIPSSLEGLHRPTDATLPLRRPQRRFGKRYPVS